MLCLLHRLLHQIEAVASSSCCCISSSIGYWTLFVVLTFGLLLVNNWGNALWFPPPFQRFSRERERERWGNGKEMYTHKSSWWPEEKEKEGKVVAKGIWLDLLEMPSSPSNWERKNSLPSSSNMVGQSKAYQRQSAPIFFIWLSLYLSLRELFGKQP